MTDKELLEFAARAAGIPGVYRTDELCVSGDWVLVTAIHDDECGGYWNSLTDSGDALRLAVKLGLTVQPYYYYDERRQQAATATRSGGGMTEDIVGVFPTYNESFTQYDPEAATRLAISIAAAKIGKEKND